MLAVDRLKSWDDASFASKVQTFLNNKSGQKKSKEFIVQLDLNQVELVTGYVLELKLAKATQVDLHQISHLPC